MKLYTRERARRSLLHTMAFRALSQIATVLSYVILVRGIAAQEFGVLNLLYAFIPVVGTVTSLGLEQTLRRFQPEYLRADKPQAAAWLVRFVASTRFATNIVVLTIVLLTWNLTAPLFKLTPYRLEFVYFCGLIVLFFQSRVLQITLAAHMRHRVSVGSLAVLNASKLCGYAFLFGIEDLTLKNAIIVDTLAFAATYAYLRIGHFRHCRPPPSTDSGRPDRAERKRLVTYGFYNNFNDAGTLFLSSRSDNFFIAAILDPLAVGAYAFYVRLSEMSQHLLPTRLFDNVVQPVFFSTPREQAEKRLPQYFSVLLNANLLLQLPMAAYLCAYHAEIVATVFNGKFIEQSWLLPCVVVFATLNVIATPVTYVAQYAEKAPVILLSKIFALYNIVAMLALLPLLGLYGAALATGTAQLFKSLFIWWHVRRTARWTNALAVFVAIPSIWGSAMLLSYLLKTLLPLTPLIHLALGVAICGGAWLIYLRSPALSNTDREILGSVLKGREARILRLLGVLPRTTNT